MGYYRADEGQIQVEDREQAIENPRAAHALGLGMVYQHFTSVPAMTVTENFVLARPALPAVIDWRKEKAELEAFLDRMPFRVPLDSKVSAISAGERQKCEILKQLYLRRRFLMLDEPTSVLTPGEADEVLGMLPSMVAKNELTILMITHKFREVMAFADEVTILRRGRYAGSGRVADLTPDAMASMMIGAQELTKAPPRSVEFGTTRLELDRVERARRCRSAGAARRFRSPSRGRDRRDCRCVGQWPAATGGGAGGSARRQRRGSAYRRRTPITPPATRCGVTSSPACRRNRSRTPASRA